MIPRSRLDIGWGDLVHAAGRCLLSPDPAAITRRVEAHWTGARTVAHDGADIGTDSDPDSGTAAIACLSVRTAFDALLTSLRLPAGSEVLVSAITIRDMVRILEEHHLVPIPVDLDGDTLGVRVDNLRQAATPRTRALLVAHLFGSRMPLDEVAAFARREGLLLIEDCAQAYAADDYRGHPASDVCMFSFGPIKTATALGGAVMLVREPTLAATVRAVLAGHPRQPTRRFAARTAKYAALKLLTYPAAFGAFARACRLFGADHDAFISRVVRGFAGPDLLPWLRWQPCAAQLSLLDRRLGQRRRRIAARTATGERAAALMPWVQRPGARAPYHTHWVFPVRARDPDDLMRSLWRAGFDATRGASSLGVVEPMNGQAPPHEARRTMEEVLYLPVFPEMESELGRLARTVERATGATR